MIYKKNTCSSQQCVHYGSLVTTVQSQLCCEYLCIFLGQFDKLCTYWLLLPLFEQNFPSLSFNAFSLTTWSQLHSPPWMQRIYAFYWFTFTKCLYTSYKLITLAALSKLHTALCAAVHIAYSVEDIYAFCWLNFTIFKIFNIYGQNPPPPKKIIFIHLTHCLSSTSLKQDSLWVYYEQFKGLILHTNTCSSLQCLHFNSLFTTAQSKFSCKNLCIFNAQIRNCLM